MELKKQKRHQSQGEVLLGPPTAPWSRADLLRRLDRPAEAAAYRCGILSIFGVDDDGVASGGPARPGSPRWRRVRGGGCVDESGGERARLFRVPGVAGVEVLHARFVTYRYAPHFHEAVTIAVVDQGAAGFSSGRRRYQAGAGSLFVIPALEVHTGEVAADGGYAYRVLYVDPGMLVELLREIGPAAGPASAAPAPALVSVGTPAVAALAAAHATLVGAATALERSHALLRGLARLESEVAGVPLVRVAVREHRAVRAAREYLDAHAVEEVSLLELAGVGGLSVWRLVRAFGAQVGLPPHAYQVQRRVLLAKRLLAAGAPPAQVAARCGFTDQAHLTRRFKALVGTTPGRYAREATHARRPGS
jgi:AraC-like DNA-binding protein